jgi:hypothetical protein
VLRRPTHWLNRAGRVAGNAGLALLILTRTESIASLWRQCPRDATRTAPLISHELARLPSGVRALKATALQPDLITPWRNCDARRVSGFPTGVCLATVGSATSVRPHPLLQRRLRQNARRCAYIYKLPSQKNMLFWLSARHHSLGSICCMTERCRAWSALSDGQTVQIGHGRTHRHY